MATSNSRTYTDPTYNTRRENAHFAGGAATSTYARDVALQARRLRGWHGQVVVAGTATTHAFTLYLGTTSIGATTLSTSTAGTNFNVTNLDVAVPSMSLLSVRSGADATGVAAMSYEFQIDPSAVESTA